MMYSWDFPHPKLFSISLPEFFSSSFIVLPEIFTSYMIYWVSPTFFFLFSYSTHLLIECSNSIYLPSHNCIVETGVLTGVESK